MTTPSAEPDKFDTGPLYKKLVEVLPLFVKDPFSAKPELNVQRLRKAMGRSHEAVYKWLRSSTLTPGNAVQLVDLANGPENLKVLATLKRPAPSVRDFDTFVYGS